MVYEWKDKVVLITGAAQGIGAATVKTLLNEQVKNVAILDVAEAQGLTFRDQLNAQYGKNIIMFIKCDVSDEEQLSTAFKDVVAAFGYIDVVVNNAGVFNEKGDRYRKEIEINYTGLVSSSLKALQLMRKDRGGRGGAIVNVASIAAFMPVPFCPIYCGTKAGVVSFSLGIGANYYYERTGVRVISISFGATKTNIAKRENIGCFDEEMEVQCIRLIEEYTSQLPEAAGQAIVDAYKKGESGSVWVSSESKPVKDITDVINKTTKLLTEAINN